MKFCLIVATKNRVVELEKYFESLKNQTYKNFKVILVDQNDDDRLQTVISHYSDFFELVHLQSEPGLSKARNKGLKYISNEEIIAFPDDDCEYFPDTLEKVVNLFHKLKNIDGITGKSVDEQLRASAGNFGNTSGEIDIKNVWSRGISFTIFLKKEVIDSVGDFDEQLGVGANTIWGSGEETDYLIRAIKKNFNLYYSSELMIMHPNPTLEYNNQTYKRAYSYGAGLGRVVSKHNYSLTYKVRILARPLGGFLLFLFKLKYNKSLFYYYTIKGRLLGLTSS